MLLHEIAAFQYSHHELWRELKYCDRRHYVLFLFSLFFCPFSIAFSYFSETQVTFESWRLSDTARCYSLLNGPTMAGEKLQMVGSRISSHADLNHQHRLHYILRIHFHQVYQFGEEKCRTGCLMWSPFQCCREDETRLGSRKGRIQYRSTKALTSYKQQNSGILTFWRPR